MLKEEIFVALIQYWTRKVQSVATAHLRNSTLRRVLFFVVVFFSRSGA